MPSVMGKVFLYIFLVIGITGFVTIMAVTEQNHAPMDATINNSTTAYYNPTLTVNKSINQTTILGGIGGMFLSPLPILLMIFLIGSAFMFFLLVTRKKGG